MDMAARLDFSGLTTGFPAGAVARREPCDVEQKTTDDRVVMKLDPYRVALLHAHGPIDVTCISGQLWITRDGEMEDIVLQAGDTRTLPQPARDVVLSTAGARCPATFGLRPAGRQAGNRWLSGLKTATYFQVQFP